MDIVTRRVAAVIPAAGRARRFGSPENKIWAEIAGITVLERTLAAFLAHPAILQIVIAGGGDDIDRILAVARDFSGSTQITVVEGGESRSDSVRRGLHALSDDIEIVLVHDAARPLLSSKLIDRIIEATARTGAAVPGLPLSDTVKRVDSAGLIRETIPRSNIISDETISGLTAVQTPQGATLSSLRAAYAQFDFTAAEVTDEASLIEAWGGQVEVVEGEIENIKITRPTDIALAETLLQTISPQTPHTGLTTIMGEELPSPPSPLSLKNLGEGEQIPLLLTPDTLHPTPDFNNSVPETRTGFGYDVHAFASPDACRKLFLGGIEIPHDCGLEGHSDADVLLHAVCDALLGAVSLGDIGILFPNTDDAFKDIASLKLLEIVAKQVREAGWSVVNIDATVAAEAPKLMPHRLAMQKAMAECLQIDSSRVSVKATTSEKLGFVGRREGIQSWAIATVRRRMKDEG